MASAGHDALDGGDEKSIFRCLDAARYVVAAAVTVLILAVIVYAIIVVLRPADLYIGVIGGSVSVSRSGGDELTFSFTVRAINPSGRVSIYYTDIVAGLRSNMSSNSFLRVNLADVSLGPQSSVDLNTLMKTAPSVKKQEYYFKSLANGTSFKDAMIVLNGTRTIEVYGGRNETDDRRLIYYCSPITIGGDKDDDSTAALDVRCTDQN